MQAEEIKKICPFFRQNNQLKGSNATETVLLEQIALGGVYEHYKGSRYRVVGLFRHSEDLILYVAYEGLQEPGEYGAYWIRPLAMFLENIVIDDVDQPRFKKVSE